MKAPAPLYISLPAAGGHLCLGQVAVDRLIWNSLRDQETGPRQNHQWMFHRIKRERSVPSRYPPWPPRKCAPPSSPGAPAWNPYHVINDCRPLMRIFSGNLTSDGRNTSGADRSTIALWATRCWMSPFRMHIIMTREQLQHLASGGCWVKSRSHGLTTNFPLHTSISAMRIATQGGQ